MLTKLLFRRNLDVPDYRVLIYERDVLPRHYLTRLVSYLDSVRPRATLLGVAQSENSIDDMVKIYCDDYGCKEVARFCSGQKEVRVPDREAAMHLTADLGYTVFDKI